MGLGSNNNNGQAAAKPQKNVKYVGKVKEMNGQNGTFHKIFMENNNSVKDTGEANPFYAGTLVFVAADGSQYKVKQLQISVPKDGMRQDQAQRGFISTVTLDLNDSYMVEALSGPTE